MSCVLETDEVEISGLANSSRTNWYWVRAKTRCGEAAVEDTQGGRQQAASIPIVHRAHGRGYSSQLGAYAPGW